MERSDRILAAWIVLLLFGIYLLSYSGHLYSGDGTSMFSVTDSFVKRGEFNTDQLWSLFKSRHEIAADGESYAKYGYGTSLLLVPLYLIAFLLPGVGLVQTALLGSAIAVALAGGLVYLAARRLRYSPGVAAALAGVFGLATPAWVYAKELWSEPFALAALIAAFVFLLREREDRRPALALLAGAAAGLAIAIRLTNAALIPFFAWYGFGRALRDRKARRGLVLFAVPLAIVALSVAWYDWWRFGHPLSTGYRPNETFSTPLYRGLYGLLFSPGKGLFVYAPFLLALPWSLFVLVRRARDEALLILALSGVSLVTFSTWYYWWGGTNWGPRFLVPMLPFLVLGAAPAVELAVCRPSPTAHGSTIAHRAAGILVSGLVLVSVGIELLGISVPALAHRVKMMGVSATPDIEAIFQPRYSPLVGYFALLTPRTLDFAWLRAADGGPTVDWLTIGLTVGFIAFCAFGAFRALKERAFASRLPAPIGLTVALVLSVGLSLFSLHRYHGDPHFGGSAGYRSLLQTLRQDAGREDVLILENDANLLFFLNENRARIRWYGLSPSPQQWDLPARDLVARLSRHHTRLWVAYDDAGSGAPSPMRVWMEQTFRRASMREFENGVHLALYETNVR